MLTDYQRDVALAWLLRQRRRASHNADIWDLRFHREKYLERIWQQVDNGEYRLLPPQLIRTGKQDDIVLWSAADALVMKWVALEIKDLLPLQSRCVHTAGHYTAGRYMSRECTEPSPRSIVPVVCGFCIQPSGGYLLCPVYGRFSFFVQAALAVTSRCQTAA